MKGPPGHADSAVPCDTPRPERGVLVAGIAYPGRELQRMIPGSTMAVLPGLGHECYLLPEVGRGR